MPSIINALTASGGGVAITGDATGNLALQTAGNTAVTVTTAQNVGIGTTSPSRQLQVESSAAENAVFIKNTNATTGTNYGLLVAGGSNASDYSAVFKDKAETDLMKITGNGLLQFNSGYGSVATAYGCRAWVNFDGTGTPAIRASGNVTSITDNGTGDYTVNFTTAMPDANYSVAGTCVGSTSNAFSMICGAGGSVLNTGSVRFGIIAASTGTQQDYSHISLSIFR